MKLDPEPRELFIHTTIHSQLLRRYPLRHTARDRPGRRVAVAAMGRRRDWPKHHHALIVCTPGLEEVVLDELAELGVKTATRDGKGAVIATLSTRELYAANALLRSATRILVRAFSFRADTFAGLESEIQRLDWSPYLSDQPLRFHVSSHSSALYHTKAIQERLQRWVPSGPPADDALRIVVRATTSSPSASMRRAMSCTDGLAARVGEDGTARVGGGGGGAADGSGVAARPVCRGDGGDRGGAAGGGRTAARPAAPRAALQLWPSFDER